MRTIAIGSVLGRAFGLYRDHWLPLVGLAAGVWIATMLLTLFLAVTAAAAVAAFLVASGLPWSPGTVTAGLVAATALALQLVAQTILGGMYVVAVEDLRDGRQDRRAGEYLAAARAHLGALLLTAALAGVGVAIGLLLLVVPGVVAAVWWSVASAVVVLEGRQGPTALARSREIVAGNGWRMLGLLLCTFGAVLVGTRLVSAVGDAVGVPGHVAQAIAGVVTAPFAAIVPVIAFYDLTGRWDAGVPAATAARTT